MSGSNRPTFLFVVSSPSYFQTRRRFAEAARALGYEVHVAAPTDESSPDESDPDFVWHRIRLRRGLHAPTGELVTFIDLIRLYRNLSPSLVHHMGMKPMLYGTVAARFRRLPAVVNTVSGLGHLFISQKILYRMLRMVVAIGYRFLMTHPRMVVIFQNANDRELFVRKKWIDARQARLVPGSGVDISLFRPARDSFDEVPIVLLASRLLFTKGVAEFVSAARILKDRGVPGRFVLLGDTDEENPASVPEARIREWCDEALVEHWPGQPHSSMPDLLNRCDIFCLPSYREGLPRSLIEAAACAVPLVSTDVPGCRDVVRDGYSGFLVPPRKSAELADALQILLNDPSLRREMGKNARNDAAERFSTGTIVEQTARIYESLRQREPFTK